MKTTIKYVLAVVFVLGVFQFSVTSLMKTIKTHEVGKINRVLFSDEKFDITFWGSSTTQNHFNDSLIGAQLNKKAFNFGINGTSFDQYQGLLNHYLDRADSGEIVVIGLDIHGLVKRKALYQPYYYIHTLSNPYMFESLKNIDFGYVWKSEFVPFYKLTQYGKHNLTLIKQELAKKPKLPKFGFYPQFKSWQAKEELGKDGEIALDSAYANVQVISNLNQIIDKGLKKGIQFIIVATPLFKNDEKKVKGIETFEKSILALEQKEVKVFNFINHKICMEKDLFYNNTHLNNTGANLFSEFFSKHFIELNK